MAKEEKRSTAVSLAKRKEHLLTIKAGDSWPQHPEASSSNSADLRIPIIPALVISDCVNPLVDQRPETAAPCHQCHSFVSHKDEVRRASTLPTTCATHTVKTWLESAHCSLLAIHLCIHLRYLPTDQHQDNHFPRSTANRALLST